MISLGQKIKKLRIDAKMTLEELANKVNSSRCYIWEIENKPNKNPSDIMIQKLSEALNVSPNFLKDEKMSKMPENLKTEVFFRNFKSLDKESQEKISDYLEYIKQKTEEK